MDQLILDEFQYWISRIKSLTHGSFFALISLNQAIGDRLSDEQRTTADGQTIGVWGISQAVSTMLKNSPLISSTKTKVGTGLIWAGPSQEASAGTVSKNVVQASAAAPKSVRHAGNTGTQSHHHVPYTPQVRFHL